MIHRIQFVNLRPGNTRSLLQVVGDTLHVAVSGRAYSLFHMDDQDQVSPALQVEPEFDVVRQRLLQGSRAQPPGNPEEAIAKHKQDRNDCCRFNL